MLRRTTASFYRPLTRLLDRCCTGGVCLNTEKTQYSAENTARFAQTRKDLNWFFDGLEQSVLSEMHKLYKSNALNLDPSSMRLLDIACGDGNICRAVADRFAHQQIVGIDRSQCQLDLSHQYTPPVTYPNVTYRQMEVGISKAEDVKCLGDPFDVALALWLFNFAESKTELLQYMCWVHRMLRRGGTLIAVVPAIENLQDADHGFIKNDPKFQVQSSLNIRHFVHYVQIEQIFDGPTKEGMYLDRVGGDVMCHYTYLYTFNTYETLLEIAGFGDIKFLDDDEYSCDATDASRGKSSLEEKMLYSEYMQNKGTCTGIFTATKL